MDLTGRRKSSNVEDRRGKGGKIAGLGIGGTIVVALIALLLGKDPSSAVQQLGGQQTGDTEFVASEQEKQFEEFASQILASTEDVWTALFKQMGRTYEPPKLVLFKGSVQSGCGVWGYHENKMFGSLDDGDIDEAINAAGKIGDDYLQKKARGYATPETFNHGTSAQRTRWLKKGLTTGDIRQGDTFSPAYKSL